MFTSPFIYILSTYLVSSKCISSHKPIYGWPLFSASEFNSTGNILWLIFTFRATPSPIGHCLIYTPPPEFYLVFNNSRFGWKTVKTICDSLFPECLGHVMSKPNMSDPTETRFSSSPIQNTSGSSVSVPHASIVSRIAFSDSNPFHYWSVANWIACPYSPHSHNIVRNFQTDFACYRIHYPGEA